MSNRLNEYDMPVLGSKWVDELTGENVVVQETSCYTIDDSGYEETEIEFSSEIFHDLGNLVMDLECFLESYKWVSNE